MAEHFADIKQAAVCGILTALQKYDPAVGAPFAAFQKRYMQDGIDDYIRTAQSGVITMTTDTYPVLRRIMAIYHLNGDDYSDSCIQRIADETGMGEKSVRKYITIGTLNERRVDFYRQYDEDGEETAEDISVDTTSQPDKLYFRAVLYGALREAYDNLTYRKQRTVAKHTFFVSHIPDTVQIADMGDKAINALTLAFPIQMLIMALGAGTGVGINAMIAKNLGRGDREQASRTAGNAMFVSLCYFALIFLFGLTSARAFIYSQTTDTVIAEMGTTYLRIITVFSLGTLGYMCLEKIVMGTGKTTITMVCQLAGALPNIVLDPIMIYGLLGCPAMGVAGAAWATVIGQFVSLIVIAVVYFKKGIGLERGMRYLKPERKTLGSIYAIGLPAIVMQILTPIMSYALNLILGAISVSAVTAYGVYYKLQNFIFMPGYGLNNASIPIISYNFGAKNKARVSQTIRYGLLYVSVIMLIGIIFLQIFARQIVGIFSVTEESHQLCVLALRIIPCGFFFAGANIILQGVCQAFGKGSYPLVISLLRFVVLALPLAWALSLTGSAANLVWLSLPVAEAGACLVAVLLTRKAYRRFDTQTTGICK